MGARTIVQYKKKFNWPIWAFLFVVAMIVGYYLGGMYTLGNVNIYNITEKMEYIASHPFRNYYNEKTTSTVLLALLVWMMGASYYASTLRNYMPGREMGSAQWGKWKQFNKELKDPDPEKDNMCLSKNLRKAYDTKRTLLNNNIACIGGSGAGKTAGFVGPNILEFHGSNIYTDPKGDTLKDFGPALEKEGVRVVVININEMSQSHKYNPFRYVRSSADLNRLITNLIANTTPADANKGDPFWDKAESLYLKGIFAYVWRECDNTTYYRYAQVRGRSTPENELAGCTELTEIARNLWRGTVVDKDGKEVRMQKTFRTVLRLLDEAAVSEDENKMSALDARMEALRLETIERGEDPLSHPALKNYYRCVRGAGDTVRSIIISANARFEPFDNEELLCILDGDDIDLPSLGIGVNGDGKTRTALFCVLPDDDPTWNFVPGMLYTQMFQELYRVARKYGNKLPIDVGCWFDEFANIKMPDSFDKILATCRSRNIYIVIILQSQAQIKDLYKDKWEGIIGNCDTIVYLGGNEQSSHKYFSELLGKWTIDKRTTGETLGSHGSSSRNYDILGRELMTPDEVKNMPNEDTLIFVRGQDPIYDKKMYWFKQKQWNWINALDDYKFSPKPVTQFELISEESLSYFKTDKTKNVVEYELDALSDFLSIDFGEAERKSDAEIKKQIEEIKAGKLVLDEYEQEGATEYSQQENAMSLEELMTSKMNAEQIAAMTEAILAGVPEDSLMDIVRKNPGAERIRMISAMYRKSG